MLKKYRCWLISVALVLLSVLATMPAVVLGREVDMDKVKAALLDDPLFLSHLRDRLTASKLDDDHIRSIIRSYLLEHPEMLIEMQDVLMSKNEEAQEQARQDTARIIQDNAAFLFDHERDHVLGNNQGDIKIVEFYDYNCGYCKAAYPKMLTLLEQDKNLSLVMKDLPILGEDSAHAHLIAQAVKKIAPHHYAEFHHKMMILEGRATQASATELALSLGVDAGQLQDTMTQEEIQIELVENSKLAYLLGLNFTPAYIVGQDVIRGAVDNAHMEDVIKQQREAQKRLP